MQGIRRQGRSCALQLLYQIEVTGRTEPEALEPFWAEHQPPPQARAFAEQLVRGTLARLPEVDALLTGNLEQWRLERLAAVVRNLLRMAAWEMVLQKETPYQVVINEAVELARDFMDEESAKFVNSVLDKCRLAAPAEPVSRTHGGA